MEQGVHLSGESWWKVCLNSSSESVEVGAAAGRRLNVLLRF